MSRYIKLDDVRAIFCQSNSLTQAWNGFDKLPSIDIVRCKECKWRGEQTESGIPYYWCRLVGVGYEVPIEHYCSYGEPSNSGKPNNCDTCKHNKLEWYSEVCDGCSKAHSNYEPKDEPQTASLTSAHISGDIYHKVKTEPQTDCPWK